VSDIEFCTADGCTEVAIGVGRWKPRRGDNPYPVARVKCRQHHLVEIEGQIQTWQVCGPYGIVDIVSGESILAPGLVRLDPAETNVAQLVHLQFVRAVDAGKPKAKTV
jgi:hypothetical protein